MKIRNGFVTNSSSSSYVIAFKGITQEEKNSIESNSVKSYIDLIEKFLNKSGSVARTVEEYDKFFVEEYGYKDIDTVDKITQDDEYLKEKYDESIEKIKDGYYIFETSVEYGNDAITDLFDAMNDGKNFVILENE